MAKLKSLSKQSRKARRTTHLTQGEFEALARAEVEAASEAARAINLRSETFQVITIRVKVGEVQLEKYFNNEMSRKN